MLRENHEADHETVRKHIAVRIRALIGIVVLLWWGASRWRATRTPVNGHSAFVENGASLTADALESRWIVTALESQQLILRGATVLDVRREIQQRQGRVKGSVAVTWRQFSCPDAPCQGRLLDDVTVLTARLRQVGVRGDRPIVVIGNPPQDWGKAGRIVWMLRTLGHRAAVLVDGGYRAMAKTTIPVTRKIQHRAEQPGNFTIQRNHAWDIQQEELHLWVQEMMAGRSPHARPVIILDTREQQEFWGDTPHGEQRGGHLPGAIHLHYRELMDRQGMLLARAEIRQLLAERGISQEAIVVTYCTGGIRSAWVTTVLADLGWDARNYAGSMWEWATLAADHYPLVVV